MCIGKHRQPFFVDVWAVSFVFQPNGQLEEVFRRAARRCQDQANVGKQQRALLFDAGRVRIIGKVNSNYC